MTQKSWDKEIQLGQKYIAYAGMNKSSTQKVFQIRRKY